MSTLLAAPLEESGQRIEDICGVSVTVNGTHGSGLQVLPKCQVLSGKPFLSQHSRRRGRQLLEGLGKLLSGLLGVGDYEDYDNDPLADNIALSLYGEWPWQVSLLLV